MVQKNSGDTMKFEVESRLDDLFGETKNAGDNESITINASSNDNHLKPEVLDVHDEGVEMNERHPLEELKSTVLSIDWEITDEVMGKFVDQVEELKSQFANNKIYLLFLQLLGSVGAYIKINQGKADPDAFKILGSAFKAFDDIVLSGSMSNPEKKKILSVELDKFKELKKKIARKKATVKPSVIRKPAPIPKKPIAGKNAKPVLGDEHIELFVEADKGTSVKNGDVKEIVLSPVVESKNANSQDIISEVLVEMKKFIRGEFDGLRDELRLRKKRQ